VYVSHTPAGTSVKNIVHFAQLHNAKKFQMYDYGDAEKNKQHYGQVITDTSYWISAFLAFIDKLSTPYHSASLLRLSLSFLFLPHRKNKK